MSGSMRQQVESLTISKNESSILKSSNEEINKKLKEKEIAFNEIEKQFSELKTQNTSTLDKLAKSSDIERELKEQIEKLNERLSQDGDQRSRASAEEIVALNAKIEILNNEVKEKEGQLRAKIIEVT